jgi:hypothetical protein
MLTIHLDETTEQRLIEACRELGCSESKAVKQSLDEWLKRLQPPPDAYELGKDLFDLGESAEPPEDPRRRQIWDSLNAKHRHR